MITRSMIVESITEDKTGILYELRNTNLLPHHDDRLTLVVKAGDQRPTWMVGQRITVEVK